MAHPLSQRIAQWERIVADVEAGYAFGLDDWLNDMDLRRGIDETLAGLLSQGRPADPGMLARLAASDTRFRRATVNARKCLWGAAVAAREGWHAGRQWWYFRRPRRGNAELDQAIGRVR